MTSRGLGIKLDYFSILKEAARTIGFLFTSKTLYRIHYRSFQ